MMEDGTVRRAIVTGGASGIGAATVKRFLTEGMDVAALDISEHALEASEASIRIAADVSDERSIRDGIETAVTALGGLDVLACVAGVRGGGRVEDTDVATWDRLFAVNVRGVYLSCRFAIPHMRERGGAIVNVGSMLGLVGYPTHDARESGAVAYCASKGAVLQLTRALAINCIEDGIRVNAVCPGITRTEMELQQYGSEAAIMEHVRATHPQGRMVETTEVADAIAYLASPAAGSTVGAVLAVDGGYTAW